MITKRIYNKKPSCISKWYSINVEYDVESLVPIPYGLSNEYSPKNLKYSDFRNIYKDINDETISMYINFRITNYKERELLYKEFAKYNWVQIDSPNIAINEYVNNLSLHNFVLSPWGMVWIHIEFGKHIFRFYTYNKIPSNIFKPTRLTYIIC